MSINRLASKLTGKGILLFINLKAVVALSYVIRFFCRDLGFMEGG